MFNAYLRELIPVPIEDIQVSKKDNYWYKITILSALVDEKKDFIEKLIKSCKRIEKFEGWFWSYPCFKYAQIKFKKKMRLSASADREM